MSVDFDREIDRAVRSMLDAEPPAALRARVLAAIRAGEPRRAWMSWAVPVAAAAVVILMVGVFTSSRQPNAPKILSGRDVPLPRLVAHNATPPATVMSARPPEPTARVRERDRQVRATSLDEPAAAGIDALAAPAPLSVETIPAPASTTMPSIQPAPLRVNALDVAALEMPRDAARGDER